MKPVFAAVVICAALASNVQGQVDRVEAAYLHRFAQFVKWPQSVLPRGAPIVIGVVGDDRAGRAIEDEMAGQRANGHPLIARHVRWNDLLTGCQIVFISSAEEGHLGAIIRAARGSSVLTVSDVAGFAIRGGMIELMTVQNRIDFAVNTGAASEGHLRISSKLLQIAHAVRETAEAR
ncbi:MAG TPA: YfiR family protein [Thermoanaerobaculia bacterium]|jgi:hypothetical protein|nr:YfiR family protein [Thermoanaerobaculia bacterium]